MSFYKPVDQTTKTTGRPLKWTEEASMELIDKLFAWMEEDEENVFFIRFLQKHGCYDELIRELSDRYPAFSLAIKKAKKLQEQKLLYLGSKGKFNPVFTMFNLKCNHGYQDTQVIKQETTHIDGNTDLNTLSDTELEDRIRRLAGQIDG